MSIKKDVNITIPFFPFIEILLSIRIILKEVVAREYNNTNSSKIL